MIKRITSIALKCIALAMAVTGIVVSALGSLAIGSAAPCLVYFVRIGEGINAQEKT
jgi:hypothetical protein